MKLKNVTLELSGKAFIDDKASTMYSVCRTMFRQWKPLTDSADAVSVMLWISDGSEILEYTGDLQQTFEWAYWCGFANPSPIPEKPSERESLCIFTHPRKYISEPRPRTYAWLKKLIAVIRETGTEVAGKPIRIGATFDNGPEFAVSKFKYEKHPEITRRTPEFNVVVCNSVLNADSSPYAAFPDGIPEGISLGEFFGKQFYCFSKDMGYDYIWLSNGMGFGREPASIFGSLFDKQVFYKENAESELKTMQKFWSDFYSANPDVVVETRGSNFSTGLEIATDAAPLDLLYNHYKIAPPVNSPWAALNFNLGLEIAAWMSHVAELPDERFPFRYYIHDPWFINSPWLDRFGREPWDIFNPLSVSRIDENGRTVIPNSVSILTVDDTMGNMPEQVPLEVNPLLADALRTAPDAPGAMIWIYPFKEYSDFSNTADKRFEDIYAEDFFLGETIQHGLPLNTVVSTSNFRKLNRTNPELFAGKVLIISVLALESCLGEICTALENSAKVLVYGTLKRTSTEVMELLGLRCAEEINGVVQVELSMEKDLFEEDGFAENCAVYPPFDGGGLAEIPDETSEVRICAYAVKDGEKRVLASARTLPNGAKIAFLRSVVPCRENVDIKSRGFEYARTEECFPVAVLARYIAASEFGWKFIYSAFSGSSKLHCSPYPTTNTLMPVINISRNDGAFYFSVFARNTAVDIMANTPLGAPVLTEMETRIMNQDAVWHPGKSWHKECRCFVRQNKDSVISAKIQTRPYPECTGKRNYAGFRNADVRFFVPTGYENSLEIMYGDTYIQELTMNLITPEWEDTPYGRCAVVRNVTGYLNFSW